VHEAFNFVTTKVAKDTNGSLHVVEQTPTRNIGIARETSTRLGHDLTFGVRSPHFHQFGTWLMTGFGSSSRRASRGMPVNWATHRRSPLRQPNTLIEKPVPFILSRYVQ